MKERDVVLMAIEQADGLRKNRPVLLLREMPKYGDFLSCGISSKMSQYIPKFDELIQMDDLDFSDSGLNKSSVVRLSFLAIARRPSVIGRLGRISPERHQRLLFNLSNYLRS